MGKKSRRHKKKGMKHEGHGKKSRQPTLLGTRLYANTVEEAERPSQLWCTHDHKLTDEDAYYNSNEYEDGDYDEDEISDSEDVAVEPLGSTEVLCAALKRTYRKWYYGPGDNGALDAIDPKRKWVAWGLNLAKYRERTEKLLQEHAWDIALHRDFLEGLRRVSGDDYVRAMSCIFYDAFVRCHIPFPPSMLLQAAIRCIRSTILGDYPTIEESALLPEEAWSTYQTLAFDIINTVSSHPLEVVEVSNKLPEILPIVKRGLMPVPIPKSYTTEEIECGMENLFAQGVKPWDDDAEAVLAVLNEI
mmetsp:Transcript_42851/g.48689  ORF Transcript_42851/g.48689 Transcript_42851/m.48689 type:complete len:303 (+) Transcript_42851:142-1050(+)